MDKIIIKLNIHSMIDVITNSSSELFCYVSNQDSIDSIRKILKSITEEFGCTAVEFYVDEYYDYDKDDQIVPGKYQISYDYECNHQPCSMMIEKIKEVFGEQYEETSY